MQTRRTLIALMAASLPAAALFSGCGPKGTPIAGDEDVFMGKADAPIVMIEYASVACPICAQWNNTVLPDFKKKYLDTGQVKLITREINAHNPAFSTAGFLLARCAGREKYHAITDAIYRDQQTIEASGDFRGGLLKIAKENGLSEGRFNECLNDPAAISAQNDRVAKFAAQDHITGTPTFLVDGEIVANTYIGMPELDAIIAAAKARKAAPAS